MAREMCAVGKTPPHGWKSGTHSIGCKQSEQRFATFGNAHTSGLGMGCARTRDGTVGARLDQRREKCSLSSNSKCNTTGPNGLRCCHAKTMLHALEC